MKYSDSYLMRMTKKELIDMIKCLEHNVEEERKSNNRQYKMLCEYEKYKWHDLRKNPEELPKDNEMVLVCYKFWGSHDSCKVAWFHNSENDICFYPDGNSRIDLSMVIAWRYIETF